MQVIGTDGGRAYNERIWLDKWLSRVAEAENDGVDVVIADDMRFWNEHGAIKGLGGYTISVIRFGEDGKEYREPSMGDRHNHPSEQGLKCDAEASNWPDGLANLRLEAVMFLSRALRNRGRKDGQGT